jgi:hypothetical protein
MKREYFEERTFKTKELCQTFVSVDLFTLQIERLKFLYVFQLQYWNLS